MTEQLSAEGHRLAGVAVASMVPSLTAVSSRGVPLLPGLLYGDREGRPDAQPGDDTVLPPGTMADAEGFLRWAAAAAPDARGYWPCQAVATHALSGLPAIDSGVTAALGSLHARGHWNAELLSSLGVPESKMPMVVPMGQAAGELPGSDAVITGGTIDALCNQIVAGATEPGDVLVIFGATLIVWAVCEEWVVAPGLISYPHTTPERFLIGGPSNAGALFVDWARGLLRGTPRPGPERERLEPRLGEPSRVPVWLPYVRGERTPFEDHTLRSTPTGSTSGRGRGARTCRVRGQRLRRPAHARPLGREGHAHRRQWRRLARHSLDGRGGRRHQPPRRCRRRPRGGGPRRRLLRPPGRRTRDIAR